MCRLQLPHASQQSSGIAWIVYCQRYAFYGKEKSAVRKEKQAICSSVPDDYTQQRILDATTVISHYYFLSLSLSPSLIIPALFSTSKANEKTHYDSIHDRDNYFSGKRQFKLAWKGGQTSTNDRKLHPPPPLFHFGGTVPAALRESAAIPMPRPMRTTQPAASYQKSPMLDSPFSFCP